MGASWPVGKRKNSEHHRKPSPDARRSRRVAGLGVEGSEGISQRRGRLRRSPDFRDFLCIWRQRDHDFRQILRTLAARPPLAMSNIPGAPGPSHSGTWDTTSRLTAIRASAPSHSSRRGFVARVRIRRQRQLRSSPAEASSRLRGSDLLVLVPRCFCRSTYFFTTSTRRFCERPSSVSLLLTGWLAPNP